MTAQKFRFARRALYAPALAALFVVVSLIAGFAYLISAWQVYGFAKHVWSLPFELCLAAAVIADLLSLAGLFATYLLRSAPWKVRAYAWFVFLLMTGLSIAAAESFTHWRSLDPAQQGIATKQGGIASQVASGAVVVALALAVHLLIIVRRHIPATPLPGTPPPPPQRERKPVPPIDKPKPQATPPLPPPPSGKPTVERPKPIDGDRQPGKRIADEIKRDAVRRYRAGERAVDLAEKLGATPKSIQNWANDPRFNPPPAPPVPPVEPPRTNGFDPMKAQVN